MKLTIDADADALYLRLNEAEIVDSEQVAPGVVLDYDGSDQIVGVEMLHLSKRAPGVDLRRLLVETLAAQPVKEQAVQEEPPSYGAK